MTKHYVVSCNLRTGKQKVHSEWKTEAFASAKAKVLTQLYGTSSVPYRVFKVVSV